MVAASVCSKKKLFVANICIYYSVSMAARLNMPGKKTLYATLIISNYAP